MALALEASDSYVRPHPHHLPFIVAAGVLLPEADDVTQPYLHYHFFTSRAGGSPVVVYLLPEFVGSPAGSLGEVLGRGGIYNLP